jgi:2,5-diamino-6-(ribosylamino)-4(3H)-pyrimidinone 5'-phosphate reductase
MHVTVNAATSVDGKLASRERTQLAISGPADFDRVDRLRADRDAIMVGVGTVLADDPSLTLSEGTAGEDPVRVVADSRARTPPEAQVFEGSTETIVAVAETAPTERVAALEDAGASIVAAGGDRVDLEAAIDALSDRGLDSLLVEGGGEVIFSLFEVGLVDELSVFVGSILVGGRDAPTLADGPGFTADYPDLVLRSVEKLDDGVLLEYDCP